MKDILHEAGLHSAAQMYASEYAEGKLSRREFLTRTTALGVSAAAAYGLIGLAAPAQAQEAKTGGMIRVAMEVKGTKDPRLADWPHIANIYRGWLEYLVQYNNDGSFEGRLLESWEANEDATQYTLKIRPNVTWNNGEPFTADDVVHNFARWTDGNVEGNAMASRFPGLVDEATKTVREGAVVKVDDSTVQLNLTASDIAIIANLSDYPSAVVHSSFKDGEDPATNPIGTGPYIPQEVSVGQKAILVRAPNHTWWGGTAPLDEIHYIDFGTDPAAMVALFSSDEVDANYETVGEFIDILDGMGLVKEELVTASTIVVRMNSSSDLYKDKAVRSAVQLAIDPKVVLELGYNNLGKTAENHHAFPIHPEYPTLPPQVINPAGLMPALEAAGLKDAEFEVISLDDGWESATTAAVQAQLKDAGMNIKHTVMPGSTFWNDWQKYPFSSTTWNHRPLAVDPKVVLELGYNNLGKTAENHHAFPIHPEYPTLPPQVINPAGLMPALEAAGLKDAEFEVISLDDGWESATTAAVQAQLKDAGMNIKHTVMPGSTFWNDWQKYPFSSTTWNHRPLAVQNMSLAYTSTGSWNETSMANPEFDDLMSKALAIADADKRRELAAQMCTILQQEGYIINPFSRSLFNHHTDGFVGLAQHPAFEHHHYKWSVA